MSSWSWWSELPSLWQETWFNLASGKVEERERRRERKRGRGEREQRERVAALEFGDRWERGAGVVRLRARIQEVRICPKFNCANRSR